MEAMTRNGTNKHTTQHSKIKGLRESKKRI